MCGHERTGDGTGPALHAATIDPPRRSSKIVSAHLQLRRALH